MKSEETSLYKCKLCGKYYSNKEMSDEHYPAKCVGNDDVVLFDMPKMVEMFFSNEMAYEISKRLKQNKNFYEIAEEIFDTKLSKPLYPNGRTARTLCRKCNSFLGGYDQVYSKFFKADGNPNIIKGFSIESKYKIIKSIYAKFLSIPEASNETFDFVDFVRNESIREYNGCWNLYFIKRNNTTDILGIKNIETGKLNFNEGTVYEFSDEKFIYNLINFEKHACYKMTNIFDILDKKYVLVEGLGNSDGYHAQLMLQNMFSSMEDEEINKDR